jgi:PBP1b-binding outer membrane lipoprotein LpoB
MDMTSKERTMKRILLLLLLSTLGLAGCVAVPAYSEPYAYGPPAYAAPAVVVQPTFYYRSGYYRPYGHHYH